MKYLKENFSKLSKSKYFPLSVIVLIVFIFFYKVFLYKLVPFPGDFIVGTYYPWLDYKWGYEVGVPVKNPILSDVASLVWPRRSLAVDIIKSGHLPLWNKYSFTGYPLFAIYPAGVMSPTFLLYFILPKIWAWTTQVVAQHVLAAFFTYLLLRHLKLGKFSSAFGGLIYAFSGFNMIWSQWNSHTLVASWIPLILYIADRFNKEKRIIWGAFLSVCIAVHVFSGYPQIVLYSVFVVLAWVFIRSKRNKFAALVKTSVFIAIGLLLTSIQTFPAFELFRNSQRALEALDTDLVFLPLQNLITFFAPDYFGNHSTGNFWGIGNYTLNTGYSGLVAFILASIGLLINRNSKVAKYFFTLFLLGLLLSLQNPISQLLTSLPFVGGAASPTRILILLNLSVSVLAAFGVESLLNKKSFNILAAVLLPVVVVFGVLIGSIYALYCYPGLIGEGYLLDVGLRNLILPVILLVTSILTLFVHRKAGDLSKLLVVFIATLAMFELFRFGWKYMSFSKIDHVYPKTPSIEYLTDLEKPYRLTAVNTIPANMWTIYGIESSAGYDNLYSNLYAKYIAVSNSGNVDATPQSRYASLDKYSSKMLDITNARYLLVNNTDKQMNEYFQSTDSFKEMFSDKSVTVLENNNALPRAKIYYNWQVIINDEDILGKLLSDDFDEQKTIILSENVNQKPNELGTSTVLLNDYKDMSYSLDVSTTEDGYLFVSDVYYPGWKALVDGKQVEIVRANYAFRAIPIEEGSHQVEFIYDPKSFKIGMWVSLGTLIFLLEILVYDKKSKKCS
jgi:uncharacterized membrane protein YfhO